MEDFLIIHINSWFAEKTEVKLTSNLMQLTMTMSFTCHPATLMRTRCLYQKLKKTSLSLNPLKSVGSFVCFRPCLVQQVVGPVSSIPVCRLGGGTARGPPSLSSRRGCGCRSKIGSAMLSGSGSTPRLRSGRISLKHVTS